MVVIASACANVCWRWTWGIVCCLFDGNAFLRRSSLAVLLTLSHTESVLCGMADP